MKPVDKFRKFQVSGLARMINEDVRNGEFASAHETINGSIGEWKTRDNYELLCNEAQIMAELILNDNLIYRYNE
ncbi:MAG: hypothetical protein D8M57_08285 [Candidatus Scalindua sp. AMX11]|nr:MAG: hypothetical protein DWQ00_05140 [Candidatus Scalindua sp.]NOG84340.1 hypothetical protein [Planctomycetota bacterium]RZV74421.1 MAG: hypothetical protein EX341_13025 [Candidatus Scalindua sp. SCAELEC01]TDE65341.1 MAG: hypothetical protein D8M57_08285 [Candidatus Scalindua sp. AMX11]GJQ60834.1 MAG: hypothetical protein SCALA701_36350 [Candidatus Scalindua sp.]